MDLALDHAVHPRQQRAILAVALDHVAEVAEVVDRELHGALPFPLALQRGEQIENEVLDFRALDLEGGLERTRERDVGTRLDLRLLQIQYGDLRDVEGGLLRSQVNGGGDRGVEPRLDYRQQLLGSVA